MSRPVELPRWMDVALLPLVNLAMALVVCAIVVAVVGLRRHCLPVGSTGCGPRSSARC